EGEVERRQAACEDRDNREADREVPERAHRAEQLLGVAQPVQDPLVLRELDVIADGDVAHCLASLEGVYGMGDHTTPRPEKLLGGQAARRYAARRASSTRS